jgi:hypothetical protein
VTDAALNSKGYDMSGIGKRISKALSDLEKSEYENALLPIFSAVEATAKKRYPKMAKGPAFKTFLADQHDIITSIGLQTIIGEITNRGMSLPEALWKFARNTLTHEAEIDTKISFDNNEGMFISTGASKEQAVWHFPPTMLLGLVFAVVSAKENEAEDVELAGWLVYNDRTYVANSFWGAESDLRNSYEATVARKPIPKMSMLQEWRD